MLGHDWPDLLDVYLLAHSIVRPHVEPKELPGQINFLSEDES